MSRKQTLQDLLDYLNKQMSAVRGILPTEVQAQPGEPENWSPKDNLYHALVWANKRLDMLESLSRGEKWVQEDYDDFNDVNREIFTEYRDHSWEELESHITKTYHRGSAYLDSVTEETLALIEPDGERPYWRVMADNLVNHPMIHIWDILVKNDQLEDLEMMFGEPYGELLTRLDSSPNWLGGVHYNQACLLALSGKPGKALNRLRSAFQAAPQLIEWSQQDSDLDSLRNLPEYQTLLEELPDP